MNEGLPWRRGTDRRPNGPGPNGGQTSRVIPVDRTGIWDEDGARFTGADVERARAEGYADGLRDGAAAVPGPDLFVPVPVPWCKVRAEDGLRGDDGAVYTVLRSGPLRGDVWALTLACGNYRAVHEGNRDDAAAVLVEVALRDAIVATRAQLGAVLIATRRDRERGDAPDLIWRGEP